MQTAYITDAFGAESLIPGLEKLPPLATMQPIPDMRQQWPASPVPVGVIVAGTLGVIALAAVVGVFYNKWAYGDWTCMFKQCMQTSSKR